MVLDAVARSLALMWRFLGSAIGLTVVVLLPVEWALDAAGLRSGMVYVDPTRFILATVVSLIAGLWAAAALLRVIDARERGGGKSWPAALFESLDVVPWLCVNAAAVVVAISAAAAVVVGLIGVVMVVTLMPAGLSAAALDFGSAGTVLVLALLAVAVGGGVWLGSLMVRWTLVTPVVVLEARRWGLERSSQLTRGSRWRCFAVILLVGAVLSVGLAVVGAVVFSVAGGSGRALRALMSGNDTGVQLALGFTGLLYSATYYVLLDALGGGSAETVISPSPGGGEPSEKQAPAGEAHCQEMDRG
jgi:hypothetical protein